MECRASVSPYPVLPDPKQTVAANGATLVSLYVCAGASLLLGLLLKWFERMRPYHWVKDDFDRLWDSDLLHKRFFMLSTLGYLIAGLATQFYPGDMNWAIQIGKVVIILAWTCLLMASCGAVKAMCPEKCVSTVLWLLGLVVVLAGLAEVVIPGDRHFQGFMWILASLALVCAVAWFVVCTHDGPKPGERRECGPSAVFRIQFYVIAVAGYIFVAILEPGCGYAGHAACYANCLFSGSPGSHFPFSLIMFMAFYLSVSVTQGFHPYPYDQLPGVPGFMGLGTEPEPTEDADDPAPTAQQVQPSAIGHDEDDAKSAEPVP